MATTAARIEANRRNARKSTGPRTEAGKAASRANSLKHGLTGAGVVLPGEDRDEVAARFEALARELAPAGDAAGLILARQVAMLSVRSERAFRHDAAATAERARRAVAEHDESRRAEARDLLGRIANDPAGIAARLRATPEGCDLLQAELRTLRDAAIGDQDSGWTLRRAEQIAGRSVAVPGADPVAAIDAELARVEAARAALDPAALDRGRAEAADRALVDAGPEGERLRRHEAATERALFRALAELRRIRRDRERDREPALAPPPPAVPAPRPEPPLPAPAPAATRVDPAPALGSSCPAALALPLAAGVLPITASRTAPRAPEATRDRRRRPKLPR